MVWKLWFLRCTCSTLHFNRDVRPMNSFLVRASAFSKVNFMNFDGGVMRCLMVAALSALVCFRAPAAGWGCREDCLGGRGARAFAGCGHQHQPEAEGRGDARETEKTQGTANFVKRISSSS